MTTKQYESVVILNAALEDEQVDAALQSIEDTIKSNGGEITNIDKWGRKRLAYPIKKAKSGYYTVYQFTAPTDSILKLERIYRLDENVIRYLTIVLDKQALEHIEDEMKKAKESQTESVSAEAPAAEANNNSQENQQS